VLGQNLDRLLALKGLGRKVSNDSDNLLGAGVLVRGWTPGHDYVSCFDSFRRGDIFTATAVFLSPTSIS
jgi:hypothetical protein